MGEGKKFTESENLFFSSVGVLLVEGDLSIETGKYQIKHQTFRIRPNTSFKRLKDTCFELWDLGERENEFSLRFMDNDMLSKIEKENSEDSFIDLYLKEKSNIKRARFALINKNVKVKLEDILDQEEVKIKKQMNKNQDFMSLKILMRFLEKFVGLSRPMMTLYERLESDRQKSHRQAPEEKVNKCWLYFSAIYDNVNIVIFFIFTLLSLVSLRPTEQAYFQQHSIKEKYGGTFKQEYLDRNKLISDLKDKFHGLFYDPDSQQSPGTTDNALIAALKISFYKTLQTPCDGVAALRNVTCFHPIYSKDTADRNFSTLFIANQACRRIY